MAILLGAYVITAPLAASHYPMMTDLPLHAANASVVRHYFDASWHFSEQFELQPFAVPYMSFYALAALLMLVLPPLLAVKIAIAIMLALLPIGLAVLCWGLRKSPLLGVAGLGLVWGSLTQWGFINFIGAIGLFALVLGLALRLVDRQVADGTAPRRPSRRLSWLLGIALLVLFFTHPFRFPMAILAIVLVALLVRPRRYKLLVVPIAPAVAVFAVWWLLHPPSDLGGGLSVEHDWRRTAEVGRAVYDSFAYQPLDAPLAQAAFTGLIVVAVVLGVAFLIQQRHAGRSRADYRWVVMSHTVVALSAAGFFYLFLALPMQIGKWWYVYPREATAALFVALALLPDLPKQRWLQALFIGATAWLVLPLTNAATTHYQRFDRTNADFEAIQTHLPTRAPRLAYLIFDHSGSGARNTPFIHLPGYIQAERGGWLSFQFATLGHSPVVYKQGGVTPPAVPVRWEWTPHKFDVRRHGPFFDWFLVRRRNDPTRLFRDDPSIQLVKREGRWWLYRRVR